jgi:hypothetical protein
MQWNRVRHSVGTGTYQLIAGVFTMMAHVIMNGEPVWQSADESRFLFFDGKKKKWFVGDSVDMQAGCLVKKAKGSKRTAGRAVSNELMKTQSTVVRVETEDKLVFSDPSAKKSSSTAWEAALAYDWAIFVARPNEYAMKRNFRHDPATGKPFERSQLAPCTGLFFHPQLHFENPNGLTDLRIAAIIHNEARLRTEEQLREEAGGLLTSMPLPQYRKVQATGKAADARNKRRAPPVEKKKRGQEMAAKIANGPTGGGGGGASATGAGQRFEQARAEYAMIDAYSAATAKPLLPVPPPLLRGLQNDVRPAAGMSVGAPAAMAPMPALGRASSVGGQLEDLGIIAFTQDDMKDLLLQGDGDELMEDDDWQSR